MFKQFSTVAIITFFSSLSFGQLNMTSPDNAVGNPIDCSAYTLATPNFFDNGTSTNYADNFSDTLTVCPDLISGAKITFSTLTATGYVWNVDASDTLYIFDGANTNAPLVAAINSATNPTGYLFTSTTNNATGCLTFVFHSNATVNNIGWSGNIMCVNPPQPLTFNLHGFVNSSPVDVLTIDSVYIDICLGDTVKLTIDPVYPNSLESNGYGYSQTDANVAVLWSWTTGQIFSAVDTVTYIATSSNGFISTIKLTDIYPYTWRKEVYIRVGAAPNFSALSATPDTICVGDQSVLFGGFSAVDTSLYGFTIPPGVIQIGGEVAGITYLPDGNGLSYTSTINIAGFDPAQVLTSSCGVESICLDMEHSYLGDLSATITCPSGLSTTLFNAYANFNTGTYLGEPNESDGPIPGNGYNYCFAESASQTMWAAFSAGNTVTLTSPPAPAAGQTMPAGSYIPEGSFLSSLAGCPLNGNWIVTVTDHQSVDNGYIFSWALTFSACNYANSDSLTYQNYPVSGGYVDVNPILSQTDSTIVTIPQNNGNNPYVFAIVDDYGCPHDTVVNVFVHFVDVIETDTVCSGANLNMTSNYSSTAGAWTFYNSPGTPIFGSNTNINTTVTFPTPGVYHLVYTSSLCTAADTATIYYQGYVPFNLNAPFYICPNSSKTFLIKDSLNFASVDWNLGILPNDTLFSNQLGAGTYTINGMGKNGCPYDTTFTVLSQAPIVLNYPNLPTVCLYSLSDTLFLDLNTGVEPGQWTYSTTVLGGNVVFDDPQALNTTVHFSQYGTYHLIFTEPTCLDDDTLTVTITPGVYFEIEDHDLCDGYSKEILTNIFLPSFVTSMLWSTGATTPTISVTEGGYYYFTISNACQSSTDSSYINIKQCDIDMPNVFTPNGDGSNDVYKIIVKSEGIFKSFHIVITNRWGNLVKEYDDENGEWDGTDASGSIVNDGVYFYSVNAVTIQDEPLTKSGFIHLIRN
jgi:gliding motility-associated-like protein